MLRPFTREETIRVLNSLGVDIPTDTKLLDEILEKRLSDALDAAQYKDRFPECMNLKSLNPWPVVEHSESAINPRPLVDAVARHNLDEAHKLYTDFRAGKNIQNALFVDPFDEPSQESAILLRFLTVLEVNETLPVFVVLYRTIDKATGASGADWASLQARSNPPHLGCGFHAVKATLLEQKMLLNILKTNNSLVPPDYNVTRRPLEERFEVSVLLPIGPLEYDALSNLNNNMGCTMCGKRASSRCSSCQSISYCGAACQRADWTEHKPACRSLKDATWRTIRLRAGYPGMENCQFGLLNRHASLALPEGADPVHKWFYLDDALPYVNVYGDRPFLTKMQITPPGVAPGRIMVYDRRQTFLGFLREDVDAPAFWEFAAEMRGARGGLMGLKMHRWVKRTGDWELSVCLDRAPVADVKW
ncbi:hypothetical protein LXA43DRAFT_972427 [Ganoderma leucocontextum]|nr:hypothetical protein LXA43DRAFT_972427 [Ganoderma leucocontextum]